MKRLSILLLFVVLFACDDNSGDSVPQFSGTGQPGSLTRFTIIENQLYVLDNVTLKTYDILESGSFEFKQELAIGFNLETIAYNQEYVFVGSQSAVYFLERKNDGTLELLSEYVHITACDPVVGADGIAFSTLRNSNCRFDNQELLDVIDYSDVRNPKVLASYPTSSPYGLAINNNYLFVCERYGVSMYDRSSPENLNLLGFRSFENKQDRPIDLILRGNHLVIRSQNGFYNATFDGSGNIDVLSSITR